MGWLWYVGMLVPMIGLVQVGMGAMADRFTYLPQIGLCIALTWAAVDLCHGWRFRYGVCGATSALVLALLMGCAWRQTSFWRNSETLWTHTLACTSRNRVAHDNLGGALADQGRLDEAMVHYRKALEIAPDDAQLHYNLGSVLAGRGGLQEAMSHYRKTLEIRPDFAEAHNNLGVALQACGRIDEAIAHYQQAVKIKPDFAGAYYNLGNTLAGCGRLDEAVARFQQALEIEPGNVKSHFNLGDALAGRGRIDEAVAHYRQALDLATRHHDQPLADALRARIALYEAGRPRRQTPPVSTPQPKP